MKKRIIYLFFKKVFFITLGAFVMAMGVSVFLVPSRIAAGGVSGISTVVYIKTGIPLGITYFVFNVILFIWGFNTVSKKSLIYTVYATFISSVFLTFLENYGVGFGDLLTSSIYGGALTGLGMGIVIINGASTGGVDLLSVILNKRFPGFSVPGIILFSDVVIVVLSAFVFSDYSLILYSFVALFVTSKVMDYVIEGVNIARAVYIISDKYQKISREIILSLQRGVTGIYTRGMYSGNNKTTLMCIVRKREVHKVKNIVRKTDPNAFVIVHEVTEALGEGFNLYQ
ncbi:MAG: YitT family protein [Ruminococcaceae bacterium]|nr:YitT family protein [Oscillospiraceae bacterium]